MASAAAFSLKNSVPARGDKPIQRKTTRTKPLKQQSHSMELIQRVHNNSGDLSHEDVVQLQSDFGNRAVFQLLSGMYGRSPEEEQNPIQKKEGEKGKQDGTNENKTGLPKGLKEGMEKVSGISMEDVKVHYNSVKPAKLRALAYTQGTDIHIGPGQEKHLPHELGHVVQQKQGRVKPTLQLKTGVHINDDLGLEKEAEGLGRKAMTIQRQVTPTLGNKSIIKTNTGPVIQRFGFGDLLEGLQIAAEIAAAVATGGGSILLQIGLWLARTLPDLYKKAMAVMDFVNTLRNIRLDDIQQFLTPGKVGDFLVKGLFGELRGLPAGDKEEEEKEKEPDSGRESKGLVKILHTVTGIFKILKRAYGKVAGGINRILSVINIKSKPWFANFSMAYAGAVKAFETIKDFSGSINEGTEKIKEFVLDFFIGVKTKIVEITGGIKDKLLIIGNPAQLMKLLANKAVDMVLNFIITHPPSALIKAVFKVIEAGSGKSIIELVRKHIPFADNLINKIAESDAVGTLLKPLEVPVRSLGGMIDQVTGRAMGMVDDVMLKTVGMMTNGTKMVKDLMGSSGGKASGNQGPTGKGGGDFLSVIKSGIHTRLMEQGQQFLVQKGKTVLKTSVNKIKGLILGRKVDFNIGSEKHELWVEKRDSKIVVIMASDPKEISEKIEEFNKRAAKLKGDQKTQAAAKIKKLQGIDRKIQSAGQTGKESKELETLKSSAAQLIQEVEKDLAGVNKVLGGKFAEVDASRSDHEVGHHMPQNAYNRTIGVSRDDGPALLMLKSDHAKTRTFSGKGNRTMKEDQGLGGMQRLDKDVKDIHDLFGHKYNRGLELLKKYAMTITQYK